MTSLLFRRIGAYVLDIAALFTVLAPLGFALSRALGLDRGAVTPGGVYLALVLNFSLPVWTYFTLADASAGGATLGKRLLGLRTETQDGARPGLARAFSRTAVKLAPWETVHLAAFGLAALGAAEGVQWAGMGLAYLAMAVYMGVAWRSGGAQSVHDWVASTRVARADRQPVSVPLA